MNCWSNYNRFLVEIAPIRSNVCYPEDIIPVYKPDEQHHNVTSYRKFTNKFNYR
ncbi:hypothetical protein OSCI_620006 [Kamptonema sp. PCC 6506]|nr:hypothetical protein OSCI_620006 [Kamptonema sp. PCC 6506]